MIDVEATLLSPNTIKLDLYVDGDWKMGWTQSQMIPGSSSAKMRITNIEARGMVGWLWRRLASDEEGA